MRTLSKELLTDPVSRRTLLKAAGLVAASSILTGSAALAQDALKPPAPPAGPPRKRVLRIAHLTDIHVQPELKADQGLTACLRHVQSQKDKPDIVFTGGDTVFDSLAVGESRARMLWELWTRLKKDECPLPVESCLGNHDVWGWTKSKSKCSGEEVRYGKKWAAEMFGVPRLYRSFDKAGWHFIILDSIYPNGEGYLGRLDDEQFAWLESDLKSTDSKTPVLILSHIPIISVAAAINGTYDEKTKEWHFAGARTHTDAARLRKLFNQHANVKLCLSGHLHLIERLEFEGVTYLCNGAVCGNWWKGRHQSCDEGYALVDLYADGSFDNQYVTYGWKAAVDS